MTIRGQPTQLRRPVRGAKPECQIWINPHPPDLRRSQIRRALAVAWLQVSNQVLAASQQELLRISATYETKGRRKYGLGTDLWSGLVGTAPDVCLPVCLLMTCSPLPIVGRPDQCEAGLPIASRSFVANACVSLDGRGPFIHPRERPPRLAPAALCLPYLRFSPIAQAYKSRNLLV